MTKSSLIYSVDYYYLQILDLKYCNYKNNPQFSLIINVLKKKKNKEEKKKR